MKRSTWLTTISVSLCLLSSTLWAGKPSTFESVLRDSKLAKSIQFHKGGKPSKKGEGKRYIQWKDGHHYTSATLTLRPRPSVAVFKKDKIVEETYDGYEKLLALLADRVGADLVRKIEEE